MRLAAVVPLLVALAVVGAPADEAASVRLLEISARQSGPTYAVVIEASEPASYATRQPDARTVVVELRDVAIDGVLNYVTPDDVITGVDVREDVTTDGDALALVELRLAKPIPYTVRSRRSTIRLEFLNEDSAASTNEVGNEPERAAAPSRAATRLHAIETLIDRDAVVVRLAGDGALRPSSVHEAEQWPPRLVIDLPEVTAAVPAETRVGLGPLERIRVGPHGQDPTVTRVVLDLEAPVSYQIEGMEGAATELRIVFPLTEAQAAGPGVDPVIAALGLEPATAPEPFAPPVLGDGSDADDPTPPTNNTGAVGGADIVLDPMAALRVADTTAEPVTDQAALTGLLADLAASRPESEPVVAAFVPESEPLVLIDDVTLITEVAALGTPVRIIPAPVPFELPAPDPPDTAPTAVALEPALPDPAALASGGAPVSAEVPAPAGRLTIPGRTEMRATIDPMTDVSDVQAPEFAGTRPVPWHFPPATRRSRIIRMTPTSSRVPPSNQAQVAGGGGRQYTGSPVSMDFQNADLRAVLRTFAEISGLNIVIDPQVEGSVDVALTDVPWDQALDIILRANQLGYQVDLTVVRIAPLTTLADEEQQRRKLAEEQALAGELVVLTRTLSYARASDMGELVTQSVLSTRDQVQVDDRTNTMIITDLQDRLSAAEQLLDTLDRAEPQVEIEARIVQANQDFARALGVEWGVTGRVAQELGNSTPLSFPNRGGVSGRLGTQGPEADGVDSRALEFENAGTAVDLGVASPDAAVGITLGSVDGSLNLDVVLSAAESDGRVKLLSNPRVTTQNNVQAEIIQGDQIPIQTVANNTVTVTFKDAALRMAVTPQITAADTVIMQIEIDNDFADFGREVNGVPPIVTQRANTTVQVANGETTVIGGIFESEQTSANNRIPGLSRIPLLGWLFRSESDRESTDELLIFLTPYIVR